MNIELTTYNFFHYFALNPCSQKLRPTDRKIATLLTILCVFAMGLIHLVCLCLYDKKVNVLNTAYISPVNPPNLMLNTKQNMDPVRRRLKFDD